MTTKHKTNIIKYILNKILKTNPDNVEQIKEIKEIPRSAWEDYIPSSYDRFNYEGMIAPDETLTGLGVLYGGFTDENNNGYGIITLFNNDFIPVKTIYEYDSGTPLRYIQCMKQAEDGTFYLIDNTAYSVGSAPDTRAGQSRFVMVNNFTVLDQLTNDYKLTLRTSYTFGSSYTNFYCRDMYKNPNSSHYLFFGLYGTNWVYNATKIIDLKVNVGSANTWTKYYDTTNVYFSGGYAIFDENDNVSFRCLLCPYSLSGRDLTSVYKSYTGSTTSSTLHTFNFYPFITYYYNNQYCFMNENEVYFVLDNQDISNGSPMDKYIGLYKYNFSNQELTTIYEKNLGSYSWIHLEHMCIDKNQNELYIQYNRNIDYDNNKANYVVQRLENDTWSPPGYDDEINKGFTSYRGLFVKNNFNLLQIYEYPTTPSANVWFMYLKKENYNPSNYNGSSYDDYNSMIPKQAEIWNNNSILFARNLYNSTINENQTNSTIVVPNSYLNDIELTKQILYSETNSEIVENTETITKNIYETLYLNFINTINVIDEDTNTKYPIASSYINQNINTGTQNNCETTYIGKIKVNKGANTFITNCNWAEYNDAIHYKTNFSIVFDENITSIDFLSNDEATIYYTLDTSSWETGKTYLIEQYLRIE